jgi:hypothetical protein
MSAQQFQQAKLVRHFRLILLWPLQLMPAQEGMQIQRHWELLDCARPDSRWREVADELSGDGSDFQERHYGEFVTFLPYVQRFLYGEGKGRASTPGGESPIRVFRRTDVTKVRITSPETPAPRTFDIAHADLYFFYDIDVTLLALEIYANDLPLSEAQDTMFRFGRAYPTHWEDDGRGAHCPDVVEWLGADDRVLATSDYDKRAKYLSFVGANRSPCIASHWEFLLSPMALHHSSEKGAIRYRQLEYHRMPLLAYLAMEDAGSLTRADFIRLGLVTAFGDSDTLPYSERSLANFEQEHCYDRYWRPASGGGPGTRLISCGQAFVMVGNQNDKFFVDRRAGMLEQFRHQYFLLYLIPHFHKASLLMLSDRLADSLNRLDIDSQESVRRFRRVIRETLEIFLRFTHRYWFHEVSDQPQARELFQMTANFLGNDRLFAEIKQEVEDMSNYLDSDALRRQASTVVRLTVVTTFGLIGTVVTGFLGMNLIAEAEAPILTKIFYFVIVAIPVTLLTFYTLLKSQRLSDFLDALSNERVSSRDKAMALVNVWRKGRRSG